VKQPLMTREAIVRRLALKWVVQKSVAQGRINDVVEELLPLVLPLLEREWCGNEVLKRMRDMKRGPDEKP
jgi:hypothetical protein